MFKKMMLGMMMLAAVALANPTITTGQAGDPTSVTILRGGGAAHFFVLPTGQNGSHNVTYVWSVQGAPSGCTESAASYFLIVGVGVVGQVDVSCASNAAQVTDYNYTVKAFDDVPSSGSRTFLVTVQ